MLKRIVAGLVLAAALAAASPAAHAAGCLSDAQARQAFTSGQARPLAAFIAAIAATVGGGNPANAQLCQIGGRLVWRVVWLSGGGQRTIFIDAVSGAIH
jgi:uncharacterized membrane protein YkoI